MCDLCSISGSSEVVYLFHHMHVKYEKGMIREEKAVGMEFLRVISGDLSRLKVCAGLMGECRTWEFRKMYGNIHQTSALGNL